MKQKEIIGKMNEHKHALLFVGGIATAIVGKKVFDPKKVYGK